MAGDAQLLVSLEARIRDFERNMQRANRVANDNFGNIERRGRTAAKNLERSFASSGNAVAASMEKMGSLAAGKVGAAFAAIAAGVSLNELRKKADEYTAIMNSLKVAGVKPGDLQPTFDQLFASAQRNAAPLDALAQLYSRVSAAQGTLKASSQEVMQVTDIVAQSLRAGGTSASQASGSLLQLAQALAGGRVQAEEYNSLLDGMRPLLQAAASGLQEAGGDVAKLTALVKDGEVSSEAFFRAILVGAPVLESQLAGSVSTSEQAMQRLSNELTRAVGEFDKATGASAALAGAIDSLAGSIGGIGTAAAGAVNGVQKLIAKVGELAAANAAVQRQQALSYQDELAKRKSAAYDMALANAGGRDKLTQDRAAADAAAQAASRKAVSGFRQSEIDFSNRLTTTTMPPARPAGIGGAGIKPVSLKDYAVPGDDKGGSGGGGSGGGGGSAKQSRLDRELDTITRRTEALRNEAATMGKSTMEVERSRIALQLEQAARREGIAITDEMRIKIDQAANGYASARVKVDELKAALEGAKQAQQFVGQEIVDSFVDVVVEGKNATEVVQNLGKALLKAAIQGALLGSGPFGSLFGGKGSGGSGGGIGGIFGLIGGLFMANGGFVSGPGTSRSDSIPARLSNGEFVVNAHATSKNRGMLEALNSGKVPAFADGGLVTPSGAAPNFSLPMANKTDDARYIPVQAAPSISQTVNVSVAGSTGDAKKDSAYADLIGRRVKQELGAFVGEQISKALRPNGVIREAARR
ncbi:tape measure protein [Bosea sp. RCC_152_1]|uniref:tape measure protein n=1 Tax=Bosea sp. RCC_152_1 TaxID=3239228 RepID=UPI003524D29B